MKILWITNILMPDIAEAMGLTKPSTGGWMPSMASFLMKQDKDLQLTIATVYKCNEPICRQINGINYYVLPLKDKMTVYQKHLENLWKKVYEKLRPDVVHIHGTEYPHGLAFLRAYPDAKAVVSMQGMIGPYSKFYLAGLTNYDIYSHLTLLDLLTCSNISINKKNFGRREQYETEIIKRVRHVIGRTSWDRAQTWAINPKVEYHFCNETLRETFYHHTWNYENCEPHSIFVSQAGYPLKGFHQLLKAMPLILREYPDAKIYVSGPNVIDVKVLFKRWHLRSNYGSYLKSLIRKLHIENKVVFLGSGKVLVGVLLLEETQGIEFVQRAGADGPVFAFAVTFHFAVGLGHLVFEVTHGLVADALGGVLVGLAQRTPSTHLLQLAEAT